MTKIIVYLAGGFKSGWQDKVAKVLPSDKYELIDPRQHGKTEPKEFTKWDLDGVERADVVLGYVEKNSNRCYGMAVEIGAAHAWNKLIIVANEWRDEKHHAIRMMLAASSVVKENLEDAIHALRAWNEIGID